MSDKKPRKDKMIRDIKENYSHLEIATVEQLFMRHELHGLTVGTTREDIWKKLFKRMIPKKFVIEHSVFIIDSGEGVSHEVDLAIMDKTYTPYIFHYEGIKFIPIEAVAAVVECKSQSINAKTLQEWSKSMENLRTSENSIARIATGIALSGVTTQKSTRPIRILCKLTEDQTEDVEKQFDFILTACPSKKKKASEDESKESKAQIKIVLNDSLNNLYDWFYELNFYGMTESKKQFEIEKNKIWVEKLKSMKLDSYQVTDQPSGENISLLTFNFQFNQLLMLINNPLLFPHISYVNMFNGKKEEKS